MARSFLAHPRHLACEGQETAIAFYDIPSIAPLCNARKIMFYYSTMNRTEQTPFAPFLTTPLLGILRGVRPSEVAPLATLALRQGLPALEVTCNTPNAPELVEAFIDQSKGLMAIGAGTVLSMHDAEEMLIAGASFLVSPVLVPDVAQLCVSRGIPYFPGAFTPQEIWNAWQAGATQVKLFPAKQAGPDYIREIKAPLDRVQLLACGGVNPANVAEFMSAGASSIAFGGSIFRRDWIERRDYHLVEQALQELMIATRQAVVV